MEENKKAFSHLSLGAPENGREGGRGIGTKRNGLRLEEKRKISEEKLEQRLKWLSPNRGKREGIVWSSGTGAIRT